MYQKKAEKHFRDCDFPAKKEIILWFYVEGKKLLNQVENWIIEEEK